MRILVDSEEVKEQHAAGEGIERVIGRVVLVCCRGLARYSPLSTP
jgi:hypothetical protein